MYAQNSILCQFGHLEICPNFANPYLTQFSSISGGNYITTREWVDGSGNRQKHKFNYPEVVGNHFLYRHSIDNHNNKQHSPISLEVVWATKYWPNRVFSFLLSITEVNVNLAATYFSDQEPTGQINFRKKLAKTLIFNTHYNEDDDKTPDKKRKQ